MQAILIHVNGFDHSDFGMSESQYEHLVNFESTMVTVDCEATDGYFDITLSDGTEVPAISEIHLVRV